MPSSVLGYLRAIPLAPPARIVIVSGVARLCLSRVFRGRATQPKDLAWIENVVAAQIEESLLDRVPRAQRATLSCITASAGGSIPRSA
jgi:hypothetical protein